jgi:hypothetical protein
LSVEVALSTLQEAYAIFSIVQLSWIMAMDQAPGHVSISGYAELQLQFALWLEDNRENQNEGSNAYALCFVFSILSR